MSENKNIDEALNIAIAAAEWLKSDEDRTVLNGLAQAVNEKRIYIPFWGEFSAGKSMLLNNILGTDILPSALKPTTARLTYIKYGEENKCVITYSDGSSKETSSDELKKYFQDSEESIANIDHIDVFLNIPMLKKGMIFVDTPGVNSLIREHTAFAANAVKQSGKIVYVINAEPNETDKKYIQKLSEMGQKLIFVRTYMDEINPAEESPEDVICKNRDILKNITNKDIEFYAVSNKKDSEWFSGIKNFSDGLSKISENIEQEIEENTFGRVLIYLNGQFEELKKTEEQLVELKEDNDISIRNELVLCETDLNRLKELSDSSISKIRKSISDSKIDAEQDAEIVIKNTLQKFKAASVKLTEPDLIAQEYENYANDAVVLLRDTIEQHFDKLIEKNYIEIYDVNDDSELFTEIPTYRQINYENSVMLSMYRSRLADAKQALEEIRKKRENSSGTGEEDEEFDNDELDEAISALDAQLEQLPTEVPMYEFDPQKIKPSAVFKGVGHVADLALLLVPGDALVAGVKYLGDATKLAQALGKAGKAGEFALKVGNVLAKNANVIDRTRDIAYAMSCASKGFGGKRDRKSKKGKKAKNPSFEQITGANGLINAGAELVGKAHEKYKENQQSENMLDMLSIAYWTGKIGENFDKPTEKRIDVDLYNKVQEKRNILNENKNRLIAESIRRRTEAGLLKTEEERLLEEERQKTAAALEIEREMETVKSSLKKEEEEKAIREYRNDYAEYFEKNMKIVSQNMLNAYFNAAEQNIVMYAETKNSELVKETEATRAKLQNLLAVKENGNSEIETKLNECRTLKGKISKIID